MSRLQVIPVEKLEPDPDIQLMFTFREAWVKRVIRDKLFDRDLLGVLVAVPNGNGGFWIVDGRHRLALVKKGSTLTELRCDVHQEATTPAEKARLKLGFDRERRKVGALEHFLIRVTAEEPLAVEMNQIIEKAGWRAAKSTGTDNRIAAVTALESIHLQGEGVLGRTLELATDWIGDPKSNTAEWLLGLSVFVRHGYDQKMTPDQHGRLREIVPAREVRKAVGKVEAHPRSGSQVSAVSREIGEALRSRAKVRKVKKLDVG